MANYRQIYVGIWDDPDFQEFTVNEKLVFIALFTNKATTESGVYDITFKTLRNITDVPIDTVRGSITKTFQGKVVYDAENSIIFVKNFLRRNLNGNPINLIRSILNDYKAMEKSSVWDEFWDYNCSVIEKLIMDHHSVKKAVKSNDIILPERFIKGSVKVGKLLDKGSLKVR